eukprot:Nk52_evm6s2309 gene=Nk52_evmTU6s2309
MKGFALFLLSTAVALLLVSGSMARPSRNSFHFDSLFVFGDSLSDIGNVLNAPITNELLDDGFFSTNPYTGKAFTRPNRDYGPQCYQKLMENRNNNGAGWSEYFIQIAKEQGSTDCTSVLPSMYVHLKECVDDIKQQAKAGNKFQVSMNYAWASAVTVGPLRNYHKDYEGDINPFDLKGITQKWREGEKKGVSARDWVDIPPVATQMDFFKQDVENKIVKTTGNDVFFLWSGANDLLSNFNNVTQGGITTFKALQELLGFVAADDVGNARRLLVDMHDVAKANVAFVVDMYNPLLMEAVYKKTGAPQVAPAIDTIFNTELQFHALAFNSDPKNFLFGEKKHIEIISSKKIYKELLEEDKQRPEGEKLFNKYLDKDNKPLPCPRPTTEKERLENCKGYLFQYDGEHPTSQTQQLISAKIYKHIKNYFENN